MNIRKLLIVFMVAVFVIGCAGQPVKDNVPAKVPGEPTEHDGMTEEMDSNQLRMSEEAQVEMFTDRHLRIMGNILLTALVIGDIYIHWYMLDKYFDDGKGMIWVDPFWP